MEQAAQFFRSFLDAPVKHIAVENPVMHGYGIEAVGRRADFFVQPWQFGTPEKKATGFWTKNLPKLRPTNDVSDIAEEVCHRLPPSEDRWKQRSRFPQGMAEAMAHQWGSYARNPYPMDLFQDNC